MVLLSIHYKIQGFAIASGGRVVLLTARVIPEIPVTDGLQEPITLMAEVVLTTVMIQNGYQIVLITAITSAIF